MSILRAFDVNAVDGPAVSHHGVVDLQGGGLESARWIRVERDRQLIDRGRLRLARTGSGRRFGRGIRPRRPIALLSRRDLEQQEQEDSGRTHGLLVKTTVGHGWLYVRRERQVPEVPTRTASRAPSPSPSQCTTPERRTLDERRGSSTSTDESMDPKLSYLDSWVHTSVSVAPSPSMSRKINLIGPI